MMTDTPKPQPSTTPYATTNMTSLTDAQLRQTITQLSNAANTQYQHYQPAHASSSQTQSTPAAKAYLKNIHTWSTSTTPRGSTRGRGRTKTVPVAPASVPAAPAFAAPPALYTHHPVPIPGSAVGAGAGVGGASGSTMPGSAALPLPAPAPPTGPPNPPKHPLPVTPQAFRSTYASRLRTGTTLLMQPILSSTSTSTSGTAATTALTARASTRRAAGMVNYAEPGSGDEFPDAGALDSDDSDFVASGGTRTAVRQSRVAARMGAGMSNGMGVFYSGNGASMTTQSGKAGVPSTLGLTNTMSTATTTTTVGMGAAEKVELDQSYLGMIPPSKFIKARPVAPTAYEYPSLDTLLTHAQTRTSFVPIRVEFDTDTHRIRDCFVWNLYETLVKPEMFAKVFCTDLELPVVPWAETVANQIRAQLEEHEGVASLDLGVEGWYECDAGFEFGCQYGNAGGNAWDRRDRAGSEENQDQNQVEPFPENGGEIPECRVILSIDVQIATHHLMDHIEWDLLSPLTPEDFSKQLCAELGLAGEAIPLIAHAVHEELIKHKRDAIEWGVIGGDHRESAAGPSPLVGSGGGEDAERKTGAGGGGGVLKDKTGLGLAWGRTPRENRGPKILRSVWREWTEAEEFRTRFEELTAEEVEKREIERERASRRLRRETSKFQTTRTRRR
ncbi:SNF5-domain-containing protein [Pisolithus marmoratus]|nr:SNF5-domain-containing protein [Pisolithus marmoratus]